MCLIISFFQSPLPPPGDCREVKLGGKDCKYKGSTVCNGAVTKEIGTKLVKICTDGKIKTKTRKSVGDNYPLVDRDTGPGKGGLKDEA